MKKIIVLLLAFTLCFCSTAVFADTSIDEGKGEFIIDLNSDDIEVSEPMSYDEMMSRIASKNGVSKNMVESTFSPRMASTRATDTYREIAQRFEVTNVYKPKVEFYVRTSEYGAYWGIVNILNVGINLDYNGLVKYFGGDVYYNLENANTIYWKVNGTFYDKGTTTVGFSTEIGVGESAKVGFNIGYASDYYQYVSTSNRFYAN